VMTARFAISTQLDASDVGDPVAEVHAELPGAGAHPEASTA
jgi:hypothetical protein